MKENVKAFFRSFAYALAGVEKCVRNERNVRFHLCAGVTAVLWSFFYELTAGEYCALFLAIGFVIASEIMNTAVEAAVDVTGEVSTAARLAKDCGAGAVLISAVTAVCCGIALFGGREDLGRIRVFFADNPIAVLLAAAWGILAFIFIFHGNSKGKDNS